MDIIAGEAPSSYDLVAGDGLPEHMDVLSAAEVDVEGYAEGELTDAELLGLAAEDAVAAYEAGLVSGPALDETALRRARRRAERRGLDEVLRTQELGVAA